MFKIISVSRWYPLPVTVEADVGQDYIIHKANGKISASRNHYGILWISITAKDPCNQPKIIETYGLVIVIVYLQTCYT